MFGKVEFDFYKESDAGQLADLMNKNRYHAARKKHMDAEDIIFTQEGRGVHFAVVAKKNGKMIAFAGAYPTSDHQVAKAHQIFIGTFLVDLQHRLSYSVIMGLYGLLMKGVAAGGYKEILTGVVPSNTDSYYLMVKCGFVILDAAPNDFGRIQLHNFSPALARYIGEASAEVSSESFFSGLPVVNKKEARKMQAKPRIHGRYIEIDYQLSGHGTTMLFDVDNYKIDGAMMANHTKFYPDFETPGKYILENLRTDATLHTDIELVMQPASGLDNVCYSITLPPGESRAVECGKDVEELKFSHVGAWFRFYPNLLEDVFVPKAPIAFGQGKLSAVLEPSTGFIRIMDSETPLVALVWPHAKMPYLDGVHTPRIKDLHVGQAGGVITITEETADFVLTRTCTLSEDKMDVVTTLRSKTAGAVMRPISQIYAQKGVIGYALQSGEKRLDYKQMDILHRDFSFSDYSYWETDTERFKDFPLEAISLKYPSWRVNITTDKKCKPIVYAPIFTFTLDYDSTKNMEAQVIEQMEICTLREE